MPMPGVEFDRAVKNLDHGSGGFREATVAGELDGRMSKHSPFYQPKAVFFREGNRWSDSKP